MKKKNIIKLLIVFFILFVFLFNGKLFSFLGTVMYNMADHGDYHDIKTVDFGVKLLEISIKLGNTDKRTFDYAEQSYLVLTNHKSDRIRILGLGIKYYPGNADYYLRRGGCKMDEKLFTEALPDFDSVISKGHKDFLYNAYYDRGALKYLLGDTISAQQDWMIAQKKSPHQMRLYSDYCKLWE